MNLLKEIRMQIAQLNMWTKAYDEGHPMVSDKEWDEAYFRLADLENKADIHLPNSPTQKVVYEVQTELKKVTHNHPMLSADKTKDWDKFIQYFGHKDVIGMLKLDGLTLSLRYMNGHLVSAETRGDGEVGEDVLHNAKVIPSIPKYIDYTEELIIDGEIICRYCDFTVFSGEYANPRNFASGSIRLLDPNECKRRNLTFVAWHVVKGLTNSITDNFNQLTKLGFTVAPWTSSFDWDAKEFLIDCAKDLSYPIDGLIGRFADREYGESLGATAHHSKAIYAFKFYDEEYETELLDIEWSLGRTGVLTPVAIFKPIEAEGTVIERASLHNLNVMEQMLGLPWESQKIKVAKMNEIIPQIVWAEDDDDRTKMYIHIPETCPCCGHLTIIKESDAGIRNLYCENEQCEGRLAERIEHWCDRKKGLDIKGISEATIDFLIARGWVTRLSDLYNLRSYREEWIKCAGWGQVSVDKILDSIENSRNCEFLDFLGALGIPLIGKTVAKDLVEHFCDYESLRKAIDDNYNFAGWKNWGDAKEQALYDFNWEEADGLAEIVAMIPYVAPVAADTLAGKTFVITGKLSRKRDEIKAEIESLGGKVGSSITAKTDYLIANKPENTTKYNAAISKGIPIITEDEYKELIK